MVTKHFITVDNVVTGGQVRYHGNRKAEQGNTYTVVRSAWRHKGGIILQSEQTGRVRTVPRKTRVYVVSLLDV